jgi:hypothetical protein
MKEYIKPLGGTWSLDPQRLPRQVAGEWRNVA